jgi:acyl-coenzyme A synthetase/AMP-(fatty) acid ligase
MISFERLLCGHPAIPEGAVVASGRLRTGDLGAVTKDGRLVPRRVVFVEEFPRTATHKQRPSVVRGTAGGW